MSADRARSGCLKRSLLGCAGLGALLMLAAIVVGVIGAIESRRPAEPTVLDRARALPTPAVRGGDPELAALAGASGTPPGRIVLDVDMLEFSIEPGEPGSALRLEGSYDRAGYELIESYETAADGSWTYRLKFDPSGLVNEVFYSSDRGNDLKLIVPPDHPLVIEGFIHRGGSTLELGGLWLVEADLELGVGSNVIAFSSPLREPIDRLALASPAGRLQLKQLGNASPRELFVDKLIGRADIDLAGAWREDSELTFECGIGRCGIELPDARAANVEIGTIDFLLGDSTANVYRRSAPEPTLGLPRLQMELHGTLGESVDVRRP